MTCTGCLSPELDWIQDTNLLRSLPIDGLHALPSVERRPLQRCDGGEAPGCHSQGAEAGSFPGQCLFMMPFLLWRKSLQVRNNREHNTHPVPASQTQQMSTFYHTCFREAQIPSVPPPSPVVPFPPSLDVSCCHHEFCVSLCFPYLT